MRRTVNEKLKSLPQARRNKISRRAAELIEEELSLRDLRKAMSRTQVEIARNMNVGQDAVSRYERRADMMLSTLQRYVSAMGGTLMLVAQFPDREPIRIQTILDLAPAGSDEPNSNGAGLSTHPKRAAGQRG